MGTKAMPCDKDCENCKFPDGIYDEMDADDYARSSRIEKELIRSPEQKKVAAQKRAYYEANKDKVAARRRRRNHEQTA